MAGLMKLPPLPGKYFLLTMLAISACSPSSPKKKDDPTNGNYNGATGDLVQCTVSNCQPGRPQLYVNGMNTPRLTSDINQPVNWQITARSTTYTGRTYAAMRLDFNPAMPRLTVRQSTGTVSSGDVINVSGQLTQAELQSTGTATVVVRDMTACEVFSRASNNGTTNSSCNNASQPSQYDTTLTASVSFTNNTYNPYGPNTTVPGGVNNNTTDLGTRIGIAAALGGLQALFGQNSGATGVLGGAVNGAISGLNQGTYSGGTSNMYNGGAYYNPNAYQSNQYQPNQYQPNPNPGYNNQNNYIRGY